MSATGAPRVLLAGGGYVGLHTALRLEQLLRPGEADVVLVNPTNYMVYQPLLPEVASGTLEARHTVVPLRRALRRTQLITGRVVDLDATARRAKVRPAAGEEYELGYDHVVVGLGSIMRLLPIPGLAQQAIGFSTVAEAIHLHNRVLERLEAAEAAVDAGSRRRALTVVVVGGGYTGVEVIAELEDMVRSACRAFPTITPHETRFVLVEATDRILPTVGPRLARHALRVLRARGIEVRLETTVDSAEGGRVQLSGGDVVDTDTLVWTAGVQPNPALTGLGLPVDDKGRLRVDEHLRVDDVAGAWGAGDNAAVPDGEGGFHPPTAQHAQREGRHIADNLVASVRGEATTPFRFSSPGELITLGARKGIASIYGRQLRGFLPWVLRRAYYAGQVPTLERKVRIVLEWLVGSAFRPEVVSLGPLEEPRRPIERAAEHTDE